MNISCDLDGVIIDHKGNQQQLLWKYGFSIPRDDISRELIKSLLSPEEYLEFKEKIYEAMSAQAEEIAGARQVLQRLLGEGHAVSIISRRGRGKAQALAWLADRGFTKFLPESQIHFVDTNEEKEILCKKFNIDLHIDDLPEILEILKTPKHRILFSASIRKHHAATAVVKNWEELDNLFQTLI